MTDEERESIVAEVISYFQENPLLHAQKYIGSDAAALYLGMTYVGLATLRRNGNGPHYARVGWRCVRYTYADLDAWMKASGERRDPIKRHRKGDPTPQVATS